jgi:hypothetical protein
MFSGCLTMHRTQLLFLPLAVLTLAPAAALAQRITVQEPSFETFGAATTVSVPDRGRASVAGSARAAMSRSTFGPFRSGTNMGLSGQATSSGVDVQIQDLDELDRRALAAAARSRKDRLQPALPRSADRAYETLQARAIPRDLASDPQGGAVANVRQTPETTEKPGVSDGPSVEKLLERARQSEAAGRRGLALTYLRSASDLGSSAAETELARLTRQKR